MLLGLWLLLGCDNYFCMVLGPGHIKMLSKERVTIIEFSSLKFEHFYNYILYLDKIPADKIWVDKFLVMS